MKTCGVILAGGKSSRMGKTKSLLPLRNKPVITHIIEEMGKITDTIVIVTNDPPAHAFLQLPIVQDRYLEMGPLAGIETALFHQDADLYILAACDMPFIDQQVYRHLIKQSTDSEAVIPVYHKRNNPLSGIYKKTVLPVIQQQLDKDIRKVDRIFDPLRVTYVNDYGTIPEASVQKHFFNMNFPEQYEWAKKL
ncbi:molybdenum cofactor guanylyltransferase [Lentibacillus sp. N15]|uniref:molybdenum cofactor guanylyltransferase n=1 Tax=Lentibacillus songyuanensis TaxID=3136161 RepID=UPI0031B9CFB3